MKTRALKILKDDDIQKISQTVKSWREGKNYEDITGFCKSATIDELEKNNFVLTPSRYVGFVEDDNEDKISFIERLDQLVNQFKNNVKDGDQLSLKIIENLKKLKK